jgi:hypothetical protein
MAENTRMIWDSRELADYGKRVRFNLEGSGGTFPAFVIRYHGKVYTSI